MTSAKTPFEDQHLARLLRDMDFLQSDSKRSAHTELSAFDPPLKLLSDYKEVCVLEDSQEPSENAADLLVNIGRDFAARLQNQLDGHSRSLSVSRASTPVNISSTPDLMFSPSSASEARSETPSLAEPAPKRRHLQKTAQAVYAIPAYIASNAGKS